MGIRGGHCQPLVGAAGTTFCCLEGLMDLALGFPFTWPDLEKGGGGVHAAAAITQTTATPERPACSAPGQAGVWAALEVSLTPHPHPLAWGGGKVGRSFLPPVP